MMEGFFYDPTTGRIAAAVTGNGGGAGLTPPAPAPGLVFATGQARPGVDYWESGGAPPAEGDPAADDWQPYYVRPLPARPSPFHRFDYGAWQWVLLDDAAWQWVRLEVQRRLEEHAPTVLESLESGAPLDADVANYRQALRQVVSQSDPLNIVWPPRPDSTPEGP